MSDYVGRPQVKIVKLHGSVNWAREIGESDPFESSEAPARSASGYAKDWSNQVYELDIQRLLEPPPAVRNDPKAEGWRWLHERGAGAWGSRPPATQEDPNPTPRVVPVAKHMFFYPAMTAPMAGKSAKDIVCPGGHRTAAQEFLANCTKFTVIGSSDLDDDLLEALKTFAKQATRFDVVGPGSDVNNSWHRYSKALGLIQGPGAGIGTVAVKFSQYVRPGGDYRSIWGFARA